MKLAIAKLDFSKINESVTLSNSPVEKVYDDCQEYNDADDDIIFNEIHEFFLNYDDDYDHQSSANCAMDENAMCTARTDMTCDSIDVSDDQFVDTTASNQKYEEPIVTARTECTNKSNETYESSNTYKSDVTDQETIDSSHSKNEQKAYSKTAAVVSPSFISELNYNNNNDIIKTELALKVEQELQNIYNFNNLRIRKHALVYDCQYIFNGESLCDVYSGKDILESDLRSRLEFFQGGMQECDMRLNDIYIRAGQFAALIKKHLYDKNQLVEKKYIEANTFSKSLKLGFRLSPTLGEKRATCYLKFIECLEILKAVFDGSIAYSPLYCGRTHRVTPAPATTAATTAATIITTVNVNPNSVTFINSNANANANASEIENENHGMNISICVNNEGLSCLSNSYQLYAAADDLDTCIHTADTHTAGLHSAMMLTHQMSTDTYESDIDDYSPMCTPRTPTTTTENSKINIMDTTISTPTYTYTHSHSPVIAALHLLTNENHDSAATAAALLVGATGAGSHSDSDDWMAVALSIDECDECERSVGMKTSSYSHSYSHSYYESYYEKQPVAATYALFSPTSGIQQQPQSVQSLQQQSMPCYTLSLPGVAVINSPSPLTASYAVCSPINPKTYMFPLTCDTQTSGSSGSAYKKYKPSAQRAYEYVSCGTPTSFLIARSYSNTGLTAAAAAAGIAGIAVNTTSSVSAGGAGAGFEFMKHVPSTDNDISYFG